MGSTICCAQRDNKEVYMRSRTQTLRGKSLMLSNSSQGGSVVLSRLDSMVDDQQEINRVTKRRFKSSYKIVKDLEDTEYYCLKVAQNKERTKMVKIYNKVQVGDKAKKLMRNEIKMHCKLAHPNIIRIQEIFDEETKVYVTMDELQGRTLFSQMNDYFKNGQQFTEKEIAVVVYQILSAISYMHSKGIVHRDIKPENIGFTRNHLMSLKILSFLTATQIPEDSSSKLHTLCGSLTYMAPEMMMGLGYSSSCDLWSLGVIMYTMMCGVHPFGKLDSKGGSKSRAAMIEKFKSAANVEELINFRHKNLKNYTHDMRKLLKRLLKFENRPAASALMKMNCIESHYEKAKVDYKISDKEILDRFKAIIDTNTKSLKRAIMSYLAPRMITQEQNDEYESIFKIVDLNGDGSVTAEEFERVLNEKFGHRLSEKVIKSFIRRLNISGNGSLTFQDFVTSAMIHELTKDKDEDKLYRKMFEMLDVDGDGHISVDEILTVFKKQDMSGTLVNEISKELSCDSNKEIDYDTFRMFMKEPAATGNGSTRASRAGMTPSTSRSRRSRI